MTRREAFRAMLALPAVAAGVQAVPVAPSQSCISTWLSLHGYLTDQQGRVLPEFQLRLKRHSEHCRLLLPALYCRNP